MSKLIIKKDEEAYWLHIQSEKGKCSAMVNLASIDHRIEHSERTILIRAIEEAIEDQEKNDEDNS